MMFLGQTLDTNINSSTTKDTLENEKETTTTIKYPEVDFPGSENFYSTEEPENSPSTPSKKFLTSPSKKFSTFLDSNNFYLWIVIPILCSVLLILSIFIIHYFIQRRRCNLDIPVHSKPRLLSDYELPPTSIQIFPTKKLGEGAFSLVFQGRMESKKCEKRIVWYKSIRTVFDVLESRKINVAIKVGKKGLTLTFFK